MDKKFMALLVVAVLAGIGIWLAVGGSAGDAAKTKAAADAAAAKAADSVKAKAAPIVKREEGLTGDHNEPDVTTNLALPGQLPALKNVETNLPVAPTKPHGQFELEGDVQEGDAEAAVRAVFPAIRDCYAELKTRAPQARGRMLMKFGITGGAEPGQAKLGELFLKETQFTDPKYLTCVRTAIDATKFPVGKNISGSVTVPLFLSPEDAGDKAEETK